MKARVLVVDDDPALAEMLGIVLRGEGFEPVFCADGVRAMGVFRESKPDLVLLDLMLPGMGGIDVCRAIRAESGVPIVMLTAKSDTVDIVLGLESGADDYIVKPFSMQELVLRLRAVLRRATPVELRLPPEWLQLRDQFRVWNSYAEIHLARGEWRDCLEVSRSILHNCEKALSPGERAAIYQRLATCSEKLGDVPAKRAWQDLARAL